MERFTNPSMAVAIPGFSASFETSAPGVWAVEADTVEGVASARTDLFIDPSGASGVAAESMLNAATLLTDAGDADFQFVARVRVGFAGTFDAGVLLVWLHERAWAKLCFEYSPDGEPMVVSVVTREVSDDANSFVVDGDQVWLRVSRIGRVYAFHASLDGQTWRFVRAFAFGLDDPARIGFEVQSPIGDGCSVTFDELRLTAATLADLRDGS